jgi:hypothetical protein
MAPEESGVYLIGGPTQRRKEFFKNDVTLKVVLKF